MVFILLADTDHHAADVDEITDRLNAFDTGLFEDLPRRFLIDSSRGEIYKRGPRAESLPSILRSMEDMRSAAFVLNLPSRFTKIPA